MTLSPAFLDEVRDRTRLSALVGRSVKLTRAGREWKGCCPFHQEKTPSFYVNDEKGFFHCFGCSAHGDAIRFLTDAGGLSFIDAVKELAAAAGLELPARDPRAAQREERDRGLHAVVARAADWFRGELAGIGGGQARAYLDRRGISAATRTAFALGFAPDARGKLRAALKDDGDAALLDAGLLVKPDDGRDPYDRFRGRLIIPIRDARGRPIAFGGRVLGDGEPKYLNSPETPLFDKGRTLFNLDKAAPAARKSGRLVVVEGYLDVLALHQAGIAEAVAPLGTALTEHQLERLWRVVSMPILCFDGDAAGRKAALRAAERAMPMLVPGRRIGFVTLPGGQDPDDYVRAHGAAAMEALLAQPTSLSDLVWAAETDARDLDDPDERAQLKSRLEAFADLCPNSLVASEYKRTFRDRFFDRFGWKKAERREIAGALIKSRGPVDPARGLTRAMLAGLSRHPQLIARVAETLAALRIDDPELSRWRDTILNAALTRPGLDSDAIEAILQSLQVSARQRRWLEEELRHRFLTPAANPDEAAEQLITLVEAVGESQLHAEAEARLAARLAADTTGTAWDQASEERSAIREAQDALRDRANSASAQAD